MFRLQRKYSRLPFNQGEHQRYPLDTVVARPPACGLHALPMQAGNSFSFQLCTKLLTSGLLATHGVVCREASSIQTLQIPSIGRDGISQVSCVAIGYLSVPARKARGRQARGREGSMLAAAPAPCARLELPAPQPASRSSAGYSTCLYPLPVAPTRRETGGQLPLYCTRLLQTCSKQQAAGMHTYDVPVWRCLVVAGRRIRSRISPQKT